MGEKPTDSAIGSGEESPPPQENGEKQMDAFDAYLVSYPLRSAQSHQVLTIRRGFSSLELGKNGRFNQWPWPLLLALVLGMHLSISYLVNSSRSSSIIRPVYLAQMSFATRRQGLRRIPPSIHSLHNYRDVGKLY